MQDGNFGHCATQATVTAIDPGLIDAQDYAAGCWKFETRSVRDPTTWAIIRHDGPDNLGL